MTWCLRGIKETNLNINLKKWLNVTIFFQKWAILTQNSNNYLWYDFERWLLEFWIFIPTNPSFFLIEIKIKLRDFINSRHSQQINPNWFSSKKTLTQTPKNLKFSNANRLYPQAISKRCRTTMWRSKTWSGTRSFKPSPTHARAETSFRLPRMSSEWAKRSLVALAVLSSSPSSTTWKTSLAVRIPRRRRVSSLRNSSRLLLPKNSGADLYLCISFWWVIFFEGFF